MRKKKKEQGAEDLELNLTPMIDVVFNLIVFFMIVIDLSQKELEVLKLPWSSEAVEDTAMKERRVIINIAKEVPDSGRLEDWKPGDPVSIKIKGIEYDFESLKQELFKHAESKRDMSDPAQPSEIFVLIRCDKDIRWRQVQHVMQACADPDVRIWKLQFATRKPAGQS